MNYLKRIGSEPEKYSFEINIHSVKINLPLPSSLQIIIKRNKNKREKTPIIEYNQQTSIGYFNSIIQFPVTLYKSGKEYISKTYYFRLIQIRNNKSIKNGKAKLDLKTIINRPNELRDLPLKNCTDSKACICINASIIKISKTLSCDFTLKNKEEIYPLEQKSNSFDDTIKIVAVEETKKIKAREKFLRRIEIVNSIHNSPESARVIVESDASSCASPSSPFRSPESPEINPYYYNTESKFSLKPVLIDFDQSDNEGKNESKEGAVEDKKLDEEKEGEETQKIDIIEEANNEESETSSYSTEINRAEQDNIEGNKLKQPINSMSDARPNTQSKENTISKAEISSGNSDDTYKCCKCVLF